MKIREKMSIKYRLCRLTNHILKYYLTITDNISRFLQIKNQYFFC